ncbi:hypothetical protein GCM10009430_37420 [Aquimarina litoralis]|uniref:Uncharacterized protein n=1 Tax=Aquimarina litoralis TaxID=584605 RepID=A0ABN1J4C2_9FLAO
MFFGFEKAYIIFIELISVQMNSANLELFDEGTVAPIPIPKIKRAPNVDINILGVIITDPTFKDFNFIKYLLFNIGN